MYMIVSAKGGGMRDTYTCSRDVAVDAVDQLSQATTRSERLRAKRVTTYSGP